jgi:hypothetical protein
MRKYNTRSKTTDIWLEILVVFKEMQPRLTVRQIFDALTVRGIVPKTESGYRTTCYHLGIMRQQGIIPFSWIADNTRWQIKPETDRNLEDALARWQSSFRTDLWLDQPDYVEIWIEKDALAGVISPITEEYDVPLYVSRGYSSKTFLYEAAEYIKSLHKPAYIYHFGDFDPSGVDAALKIKEGLLEHGADVHFQRIAVTERQIRELGLPTRETKRSDPRSKNWGDRPSVELDALPAPFFRELVRLCIEQHIDQDILKRTRLIEQRERETLFAISQNFVQDQNSSSVGGHD